MRRNIDFCEIMKYEINLKFKRLMQDKTKPFKFRFSFIEPKKCLNKRYIFNLTKYEMDL